MFDRSIPVIGFHTLVDSKEGIDALIRLMEDALIPKGVNTLIAEMRYEFRCFPEYSSGKVTYEDASRLADVCESHGVRLVPLLPSLATTRSVLPSKPEGTGMLISTAPFSGSTSALPFLNPIS